MILAIPAIYRYSREISYFVGVSRQKLPGSNAESLYHVVGPHPQSTNNTISQQSKSNGNNFISVYDEPHFEKAVYDDPTLPSFRV